MSPQLRRFLPLILIAVLLFTLLPLLSKRSSSGPSAADRSRQTQDAVTLIDRGEQHYRAVHGRYTSHLADLVPGQRRLADDLALGLRVQLDVSGDGNAYVAQVVSDVISVVRSRSGDRLSANRCLVLKSGSGVACPAGTTGTTSTSSGTTTR